MESSTPIVFKSVNTKVGNILYRYVEPYPSTIMQRILSKVYFKIGYKFEKNHRVLSISTLNGKFRDWFTPLDYFSIETYLSDTVRKHGLVVWLHQRQWKLKSHTLTQISRELFPKKAIWKASKNNFKKSYITATVKIRGRQRNHSHRPRSPPLVRFLRLKL